MAQARGLVVELVLAAGGVLRSGPACQGRLPRGRVSFGLHAPWETPPNSGSASGGCGGRTWRGPAAPGADLATSVMTRQPPPCCRRLHPKRSTPGAPPTPLPTALDSWGARGLGFPRSVAAGAQSTRPARELQAAATSGPGASRGFAGALESAVKGVCDRPCRCHTNRPRRTRLVKGTAGWSSHWNLPRCPGHLPPGWAARPSVCRLSCGPFSPEGSPERHTSSVRGLQAKAAPGPRPHPAPPSLPPGLRASRQAQQE